MNAMERIKEMQEWSFMKGTRVPDRWQAPPLVLPMTIAEDFQFLLRAFNTAWEIVLEERKDAYVIYDLEKEFNKRMGKAK